MTKQVINIGATANDGTGDPTRTWADKVNDNFDELYLYLLPAAPTTDAAPGAASLHGANAYPQATGGNQAGADLNLSGGIGSRFFTVVDFSALAGKVVTITLNGGSPTTLTEGVDWNAVTSNAVTATNIAGELNAGDDYTAAAVGAVVYITPGKNARTLTISTDGGADLTATSGADGVVNAVGQSFLIFTNDSADAAGNIEFVGGDGGTGAGGNVQLQAGHGFTGGAVVIAAGRGTDTSGSVALASGDSPDQNNLHSSIEVVAASNASGGEITLNGGSGLLGGSIALLAGGGQADGGGNVLIATGLSESGNGEGGDFIVTLGAGFGTGRDGQCIFNLPAVDPEVVGALYVGAANAVFSSAGP